MYTQSCFLLLKLSKRNNFVLRFCCALHFLCVPASLYSVFCMLLYNGSGDGDDHNDVKASLTRYTGEYHCVIKYLCKFLATTALGALAKPGLNHHLQHCHSGVLVGRVEINIALNLISENSGIN